MKNKNACLYIIPGWQETIARRPYQKLLKALRGRYDIVPVTYTSKKGRLLSENIDEVLPQLREHHAKNDILFGFSIGAVLAFEIASKLHFKKVFICSMTALLENDTDEYPPHAVHSLFTKAEVAQFKRMRYKKPLSPIVYFYGAKERPEMKHRTNILHKKFGGKVVAIPHTDHELSDVYLKKILDEIQN